MEGIDLKGQKYLTEQGAKEIAEHPAQLFIGVYPQQYSNAIPSYGISIMKGIGTDSSGNIRQESLVQVQGDMGFDTRDKALKLLREILKEAITLSAKELADSKYDTLSMEMVDKIIEYYRDEDVPPWASVAHILGVIEEGRHTKMHS